MRRATAAAQPWVPGVFDPETQVCTSSAPAIRRRRTRRPAAATGAGLFTCSLVAVNVDTGKMAWYYQTSPRDMHDWDSAQTPVLIDAMINGRPRKLVSTGARNGYFFTVDRDHRRARGQRASSGRSRTGPAASTTQGRPVLNPEKVATIRRLDCQPAARRTGRRRRTRPTPGSSIVPENNSLSIRVSDRSPIRAGSMGLGGRAGRRHRCRRAASITAIDPKTAKSRGATSCPAAEVRPAC